MERFEPNFMSRHPRLSRILPKAALVSFLAASGSMVGSAATELIVVPIVSDRICEDVLHPGTLGSEPLAHEEPRIGTTEFMGEDECRLKVGSDLSEIGIGDGLGLLVGAIAGLAFAQGGYGLHLGRESREDSN